MKCLVCGNPVPCNIKGYRGASLGRPKTYCSDHCANYMKFFNAMQKELDLIDLDDKHKRKIRGELFRVANTLKLSAAAHFSTKKPQGEKDLKNV